MYTNHAGQYIWGNDSIVIVLFDETTVIDRKVMHECSLYMCRVPLFAIGTVAKEAKTTSELCPVDDIIASPLTASFSIVALVFLSHDS